MDRYYTPEVNTLPEPPEDPKKQPPHYLVDDDESGPFAGGDVKSTEGAVEQHVNKPKHPGRTIAIGGILFGAIIVGGCNALPDHDRKALSPYPVTSGILPTELRAPSPDASNPRPTGTRSPEAVYPQLRKLPNPDSIPALGTLCLASPMEAAKTVKAENGTLVVRVDGRCVGGDRKKANTAEVLVYSNPDDVRSELFRTKTDDIANLLCIKDGPRVSTSNDSSSEAWAQADIYDPNGVYKGRGFIPDAVTGFAAATPMNGKEIPPCGQVAKPYFP